MSQDWSSPTVVLYSIAMLLPMNSPSKGYAGKGCAADSKESDSCACPTVAVEGEALEFYKCSFL